MVLDMQTAIFMGACVLISTGIALLAYWFLHRKEWSAFAFAAAMLTEGAAVMLLAFHPAYTGAVWIPATLLFTASLALSWAGVQLLTANRIGWSTLALTLAGVGLPVLLAALPAGPPGRATGTLVFAVAYVAMAVIVIRARGDRVWAHWVLAGLFVARAVTLLLHGLLIGPDEDTGLFVMGLLHVATPFSAVGIAIFLIQVLGLRRETRFRYAAEIDALTGAWARRTFFDKAERLLARSLRNGEPLTLFALDLDHFKRVNDKYGHPFGDDVLRVFSASVRDTLRPGDLFGRVGGEEFMIALPGCDEAAAVAIAQRINERFALVAEIVDCKKVQATVSIGVATGSARTLAGLISDADRALYQAKAQGRNRTVAWRVEDQMEDRNENAVFVA